MYLDSYGVRHIYLTIEKYLKKYRFFFNIQLQHAFSSHCGFFTISFILSFENNTPLHKFIKMFHRTDMYLNNYICIKIINTFIKHMYLRN